MKDKLAKRTARSHGSPITKVFRNDHRDALGLRSKLSRSASVSAFSESSELTGLYSEPDVGIGIASKFSIFSGVRDDELRDFVRVV